MYDGHFEDPLKGFTFRECDCGWGSQLTEARKLLLRAVAWGLDDRWVAEARAFLKLTEGRRA